jgi:outer membrane autotransporter protein
MKVKPGKSANQGKILRGKLTVLLLFSLVLPAFLGWSAPPVAAQSAVPPGLVLPIGTTIRVWESGATDYSTPNSVNLVLAYKGGNYSIDGAYNKTYASFPVNQGVPEIMPSQPLYFVRLYNPASGIKQMGSWIMRAADVRGLTPEQLRDRFALPAVPTMITYVLVPANVAPLWVGYAGPIAGWGRGGAQQLYIMSQLHDYKYNNPNVYLENTNYTAVENANWPYIPITSYFHGQALTAQALSYAQPLQGRGNAGKIGAYLDRFIPAAYSDLENVYTALDYLNFADYGTVPLQNALNQMGPERYSSLGMLGQRNSLLFGDALLRRSQDLRQGWAGGELSGGTLGQGLGRLAQMAYVCGFSDPRLVSTTLPPAPEARRGLGLWARGVGEFGNQASGSNFTGFGYNTGGVVGGVDYQPRQDVVFGFGAGYLGSNLNWNNNGGQANVNNAKFGLYATYFTPRFFLDGVFTGGVNWTGASRRLVVTDLLPGDLAINRTATSNSTGHDLALHLQGGVNLPVAGWELTPLARLSYFYQAQDAFAEQGADSLNLTVQGFSTQTLRTQLGLRAGRTFATQGGVRLRPECQLAWAHDFPLDNRVINAGLTELGGTFPVNGFQGETDSLLAGVGLSARLSNGVAITGRYDAELRRGFQAQMVNLGVRCDF